MNVEIRSECLTDRSSIRSLNQAAFGGTDEADLVDALRDDGFVAVSLIAEHDGQLVGHVQSGLDRRR